MYQCPVKKKKKIYLFIVLSGVDLEGGPRCPDPHPTPLKFEKCPFYLGFLGFLQIHLVFFMLWCPFYNDPPPPPSEKLDPPQLMCGYERGALSFIERNQSMSRPKPFVHGFTSTEGSSSSVLGTYSRGKAKRKEVKKYIGVSLIT